MRPRRPAVLALAGTAALLAVASCATLRKQIVVAFTPDYVPTGDRAAARAEAPVLPEYEGRDAERPKIPVVLRPVGRGFAEPTDVQAVPGSPSLLVVLEKGGAARWLSLEDGAVAPLLEVEVETASEEGLLGLAFHPRFPEDRRFYLNYVADRGGDRTVVEEWELEAAADPRRAAARPRRVLLEIEQPWPNHNAGQLAFGPDGMLYVGTGDGGFRDDPRGHGQDLGTLLGAMLRIDPDRPADGRPYGIPADNPFVGRPGARPEIWAYGLRNPWRYSFTPDGRLVVADVGQDRWEEIDLVERGANLGWNVKEGRHCFRPPKGCRSEGLVDPVFEYDREDGQSITGGFVYAGQRIPALAGKYVHADFVRGRLWAIALPAAPGEPATGHWALGKFPILPSAFGVDLEGEHYVADFASGTIFRLEPPPGEAG